jgi:predicted ATPase/DNA-binding CsgD family transcriptional regulator
MAGGGRAQRRTGRLPADLTNFVGRGQEVGQVKHLLAGARLVTLTGAGGTGKTRLALRVAGDLGRAYADGAWLVDLARVPEQGVVEYAVAEALGAHATVVDFLRERELLLVLDNCEHVLDGCAALVAAVLPAAPGVRVLCTSRQPLGTTGEHVWRVPPLPVPATDAPLSPAVICRYPSVALFAARAEAASPGFLVTEDNHALVAEVCRRLDGLPLAIELAAAQMRTLSLGQLAARLRDRFPLLSTRYAQPAHHRTLEATFDWSFELCTPAERELWTKLSVFVDGIDLAAAEYVCAEPVADAVAGLVDKSVLLRDESSGHLRYRLLETVRQYGLSRLRAGAGDEAALLRRHRDWFLGLVERFDRDWFGPGQEEWAARLRRERSNVCAALQFCLTAGEDDDCALRFTASLEFFWLGCGGSLHEGRYWLDRVLAQDRRPTPDRARVLAVQTRVLNALSELEAAGAAAAECLELADRLGEGATAARATGDLGVRLLLRGDDLATAQAMLEDAVSRLEPVAGPSFAIAQVPLAMAILYQGDADRAAAVCAECCEFCRSRGERWWLAHALAAAAIVDLARDVPARAEEQLRASLALRRDLGDTLGVATALDLLAAAVVANGGYGRGARLLGAANATWRAIGHRTYGSEQFRDRRHEVERLARVALGAEAFEAAYRAGEALPVEECARSLYEPQDQASRVRVGRGPGVPLSTRELEVSELVARGLSNKEIAAKLVVARRTAESHVENILRKLEFGSRAQIAAWYVDQFPSTYP